MINSRIIKSGHYLLKLYKKKKKKDLKALFITIWYLQRKGIDIMQSKTPTDKNSIKIQRTNN